MIHLACISLLAFVAYLRADKIIKLECCNVKFTPQGVEKTISLSKIDQFWQGQMVGAQNPTCPVPMLEKYVAMEKINLDIALIMVLHHSIAKRLRAKGGLSYITIHELVRQKD